MRTLLIIVAGLLLLGAFLFTGSRMGGATAMVTAAKLFIPLWLVAALINMGFGVVRAGYSVVDETPIALVIFAVPAVAAAIVWRKFS